jgi:hypothetical protein
MNDAEYIMLREQKLETEGLIRFFKNKPSSNNQNINIIKLLEEQNSEIDDKLYEIEIMKRFNNIDNIKNHIRSLNEDLRYYTFKNNKSVSDDEIINNLKNEINKLNKISSK